jgi:hypothetical protein
MLQDVREEEGRVKLGESIGSCRFPSSETVLPASISRCPLKSRRSRTELSEVSDGRRRGRIRAGVAELDGSLATSRVGEAVLGSSFLLQLRKKDTDWGITFASEPCEVEKWEGENTE